MGFEISWDLPGLPARPEEGEFSVRDHSAKSAFITIALILMVEGWGAPFVRGAPNKSGQKTLTLKLRTRVEPFKGSGAWREIDFKGQLPVNATAIVICDMWDKHWCSGATGRVEVLAHKMAPLIDQARAGGIQIIHAPSEVVDFYSHYPQRIRILGVPVTAPPPGLDLPSPPLPIDDKDGGCDTGENFYKAWSRENPAISVTGDDVVSADGKEIYSFLVQHGIKNILIMGVHTNMCVLNRSFAIQQMTKWGIRCVLVRDLTDAMYNPKDRPYVPHEQGTELVIEYIEANWCPSTLSGDLVHALRH
jgi:nicotinamidase-related amidase